MHTTDTTGPTSRWRASLAALLTTGLVLAWAAPASAAGAARSAAPADTSKPVMFLKQVVVTGERYPHAYFESPQSLSFISGRALREQAPVVLGDVLATLPGVDSNKDSPWEQRPSIRGLTDQRVLVLVDGIPMNSARGNGPHSSLVDPSQVERIEVVRGPSSVAYGSDALGGVINIITRQPGLTSAERQFRGTATLGGSVEGLPERNGSLNFDTRWNKLSAFLAGGGRKADDYKNADGTVPQSGFSDWNALANLRYDFTDRLALKGGYQLYRGRNIGIPGLAFSFAVPGMGGASQLFNFPFYDRDFAHLTLEHLYPASSWLANASVTTYWQREHRNFWSDQQVSGAAFLPAFGFTNPPAGTVAATTLQDRFFDLNTYGLQFQMTSVKTTHYRFSSGLDLARDLTGGDNRQVSSFFDSSGASAGSAVVPSASVPTGRFDSYAAYVQGEFFFNPQWTLDAGGRYTHYRYRTDAGLNGYDATGAPAYFPVRKLDDDALSGSVGLVYSPLSDLHITANIASGYREPNAQDLYFSGPGSVGFVVGNPDLKPERSVSYDAGLRWGPGDFAFSGNAFYSTFNDLIDAVVAQTSSPLAAPGQPTYQYVNIAKARMYGGEVEAEWQFHPQWRARTAMSVAVGDITSQQAIQTLYFPTTPLSQVPSRVPLDLVPPFGGSASLRWTEAARRFWAEAGTRYSWRYDKLPPVIAGVPQLSTAKKEWIVADLAAGLRLETGQRLELGVRNLTDLRYRQALASVADPGRTFYTSISSDF